MDKIFKIGLLILGVAFLLLYFFGSQNNRYILKEGKTSITVFDTRKGIIYATSSAVQGKWVLINPIAKTNVK